MVRLQDNDPYCAESEDHVLEFFYAREGHATRRVMQQVLLRIYGVVSISPHPRLLGGEPRSLWPNDPLIYSVHSA